MIVVCRHLSSVDRLCSAAAFASRKGVIFFRSKPRFYSEGCLNYCICNMMKMNGEKDHSNKSHNKKLKTATPAWKPITTQSSSNTVLGHMNLDDGCQDHGKYHVPTTSITQDFPQQVGLVGGTTEPSHSNPNVVKQRRCNVVEETTSVSLTIESGENLYQSGSFENNSPGQLKDAAHNSSCGAEKHSISIEVGAPLIRFVKGKFGFTQRQIENDAGVKLIFPSSKKESFITIEGSSVENVEQASEKIRNIIEEAAKSRSIDYSHFISLPLAVHGELVEKLMNFQNCILGDNNFSQDGKADDNSEENSVEDKEEMEIQSEGANINVKLAVQQENHVKMELGTTSIKSYEYKQIESPASSDSRIERSIFIKPNTFHLTVLMLKLYNNDHIALATEVLQSISSKVKDALDNRPISVRLKGLACMRGSPAKARVIYAPVEEIGEEGRLLRACRVIIDAYIEAGLVSKEDVREGLKLHATLMNVRHRKRKKNIKKFDSFDARGIFKTYGSTEWGDYLIQEVHLSQRFKFDERGYYHCCSSIPFPEDMQIE